jgi:two-component system chemotaxis response regulator CheB
MEQIRVLVVEDSLFFREFFAEYLSRDNFIQVVAAVGDPYEARDAILDCHPDIVLLDALLPGMSGIEFIKRVMSQYPLPVIVISAKKEMRRAAYLAGAVEFLEKPCMANQREIAAFAEERVIPVIRRTVFCRQRKQGLRGMGGRIHRKENRTYPLIAIGASTGGTQATECILKQFGSDIPGVVVVQHMPEGFTRMYAGRLNEECRVRVKEARSGDLILPGQVLIAPGGDSHMEVVKTPDGFGVVCRKGEKVNGHCPSVDVLFQSVAAVAGKNALGILLTGMGSDGAKGLLAMRKAGARTIGQDESTCVVYGMPKVAKELGAVEFQVKVQDIASRTYQLLNT